MDDAHEYPFFTHRSCRFFPCHDDIDPAEFNCLFCYCPLYALGDACKGRFRINENGVKDCTGCSMPHKGDAGTKLVKARFKDLARLTAERMAPMPSALSDAEEPAASSQDCDTE